MQRQIILDTETTGLSHQKGDRLIELGCLEMIDRKLSGRFLHFYFNPDRMIEAGALKVHGITNEFLEEKPRFYELAHELMEFIKGSELIIHNADFDIGFLNAELGMLRRNPYGVIQDHCSIVDTLALARQLHPGQRNSLDALCNRYQISNAHRKLHGALLDAEILATVYLFMTGGQEQLFVAEAAEDEAEQAVQSAGGEKRVFNLRRVMAG